MRQFKIVMMGSGGVGKTSIAGQYIKNHFEINYEPTIEDVHNKTVTIDGEQCLIELLDTAGEDQFTQMRDLYIREGHVFILVYSIAEESTFEDVQIIHEQIIKSKCSTQVPIVLVGNKRDLENAERTVGREAGEDLERKWPFSKFLEISAKNLKDVEGVFTMAVQQVKLFEGTKKDRISALQREATSKRRNSKKCIVM